MVVVYMNLFGQVMSWWLSLRNNTHRLCFPSTILCINKARWRAWYAIYMQFICLYCSILSQNQRNYSHGFLITGQVSHTYRGISCFVKEICDACFWNANVLGISSFAVKSIWVGPVSEGRVLLKHTIFAASNEPRSTHGCMKSVRMSAIG